MVDNLEMREERKSKWQGCQSYNHHG